MQEGGQQRCCALAECKFHTPVAATAQDVGDTEGRQQRYREVPAKLRSALAELKAHQPPLAFVTHMGGAFGKFGFSHKPCFPKL